MIHKEKRDIFCDTETEKILVNPFIFPSELSFYFVLMLITLSAPAFSLTFSFVRSLPYPQTEPTPWYPLIALPLLTLILLPFLTLIFSIKGSRSKVRKYGKNKLSEKYPEISDLISHLSQKMGIKTPNSFYVDTEELNALAFGSRKQTYMLISRGLVEKFEIFPDMVETILTHELSHLKNNDLMQHEVAEALWKSFAIVSSMGILYGLIYGLAKDHDWIIFWLTLVLFVYVIPFMTIFYLNNVIQRWREIYADVRTIALQRSDRNLITFLRLFSPSLGSKLKRKLLSPFILTPRKRIKTIREDVFKHILERGAINGTISMLSLITTILSLTYLKLEGNRVFEFVAFIWLLINYLLISIVVLPFYTLCFTKKIKHYYQDFINCFIVPIKISLIITFPVSFAFVLTRPLKASVEIILYFIAVTYLFLLAHQIIFKTTFCLTSLKVQSKTRVFFSESILVIILFSLIIYFLNLPGHLDVLLFFVFDILLSILLLLLVLKYSKCPHCGGETEAFLLFKCPYCSQKLNEDFVIYLQ